MVTNSVAERETDSVADNISAELFGVVLHRYLATFLQRYLS